ncbi:hypothetical protein P279_17450 [Rhodobacteraceae bacterium PD-2]|nr:hypothetical protein P279_17450 [Rhodobacteraceae bacterium PD-2]
MPEGYCKILIRQIGQQAHSEIVSQLPVGTCITRALTLERKQTLLSKARTRLAMVCTINTNDELRQRFVNETVTRAQCLGLIVPDETLK